MRRVPRPGPVAWYDLRAQAEGARAWRSPASRVGGRAAESPLLLASASPRRRALLRRLRVPFWAADPGEEADLPQLGGWRAAAVRALQKARLGARACPGLLCLGADTVVVWGEHTLGKPKDAGEATAMLSSLSGRKHQVYTAFCLAWQPPRTGGKSGQPRPLWLEVIRSTVRFRHLNDHEIAAYVESGAPLDKAGGYGVQDRRHQLVESVAGSYYNVVGLPMRQVVAALAEVGWRGRARGLEARAIDFPEHDPGQLTPHT
jgi:septum formation protein